MKALLAIMVMVILLVALVYASYKIFTEGPHPWDFHDFDKDNKKE